MYRTVGWRVIAIGASVYLGLYVYERLRWNTRAKEAQFKTQLRSHLASRLKQVSHTITMNCDSQVTRYRACLLSLLVEPCTQFLFREMQEVLSRLQALATEVQQEMKTEVDQLQKDVTELEKIAKDLAQIK